jgi:hypothetical protein
MRFFEKATLEEQVQLKSLDQDEEAGRRVHQSAVKARGDFEESLRKKYGLPPFTKILRSSEIEGQAQEVAFEANRKLVVLPGRLSQILPPANKTKPISKSTVKSEK